MTAGAFWSSPSKNASAIGHTSLGLRSDHRCFWTSLPRGHAHILECHLQNHNLCEIGILRRWPGHYLALTCAAARRRRRCWGVVAGGAEAVPETWRSRCLGTTPSSSGSGLLASEIFHHIFNMSSRIYQSYSKKKSLPHSLKWIVKHSPMSDHQKHYTRINDHFKNCDYPNCFIDLGFYSPKSFVEF